MNMGWRDNNLLKIHHHVLFVVGYLEASFQVLALRGFSLKLLNCGQLTDDPEVISRTARKVGFLVNCSPRQDEKASSWDCYLCAHHSPIEARDSDNRQRAIAPLWSIDPIVDLDRGLHGHWLALKLRRLKTILLHGLDCVFI